MSSAEPKWMLALFEVSCLKIQHMLRFMSVKVRHREPVKIAQFLFSFVLH